MPHHAAARRQLVAFFGEQATGLVVVRGCGRPANALGNESQGGEMGLALARVAGELPQTEVRDRDEGSFALFGVEQPPGADDDIGGRHHRGGP
jgi:hypothetical protein